MKTDSWFLFFGEALLSAWEGIKVENRIFDYRGLSRNSCVNLPNSSIVRSQLQRYLFFFGKWSRTMADKLKTADRVRAPVRPGVELSRYSSSSSFTRTGTRMRMSMRMRRYVWDNTEMRACTYERTCARVRADHIASWPLAGRLYVQPDSLPGVSYSLFEVDFC